MNTKNPFARRAILYVSNQFLLWLVTEKMKVDGHHLFFRSIDNIPETAIVMSTWTDPHRDGVGFMLHDDSFSEVPPGAECPVIHAQWTQHKLKIVPDNE